jgi:hypothetical protein
MIKHFFYCPYRSEVISILLDPSTTRQQYLEDYKVCCNPIELRFEVEERELIYFEANSIEQ